MDIQALETKAEEALNYLATTDESHAKLKARQNLLAEHRKAVVAAGFESSSENAAEAKRQAAHNTPEYHEHLKLMEETDINFLTIHNKRLRAVATIDLYRTMCANQRRGN